MSAADTPVDALVIGAGPAGLMAAEMLAAPNRHVVVADAMPTPARKFLMAGKSGLNLTRAEDPTTFAGNFASGTGVTPRIPDYFRARASTFGPAEAIAWAEGLGVGMFTGSTGRVFPVGMKASPLLRAWLARLRDAGVELRSRWRWQGGLDGFDFSTPSGMRVLRPRVCVLALGGASWPRLGSDAAWVPWLRRAGVTVEGFRPANMGLRVDWSPQMSGQFGAAVKGTAIHAGGQVSRGEWIIGRQGIEGGGIYQVAAALRDGVPGQVDLAPDVDHPRLARRFATARGKLSVGTWLRRVLNDPVKVALMLEWGRPLPEHADGWARRAKALPLRHAGPMGLDRAISSAGGVAWSDVTEDLELRALPDVFVAGEMLDWEAPTGGYLLTGCLSTGQAAGKAGARRLIEKDRAAQGS